MAFDGYVSYEIALGVVTYLFRETEYFPWYSAGLAFDRIDKMLKGTNQHEDFRKFVNYRVQGMVAFYGVENVDSNTIIQKLAREFAIDWSCRLGDEDCLNYAYDQLKNNEIRPALQITFYCNGLKHPESSNEFEKLFNRMIDADFQTERLRIIDGLLCSTNEGNLAKFLKDSIDTDSVFLRIHERRRIFSSIATRSEVGFKVLDEFIREYQKELTEM